MRIQWILFFFILNNLLFAQSKSLFSLLPSKTTGITFNNKIEDTRDQNILIYSNFYGGAGVGVGDFNRDGLSDLFFAGNLAYDDLYLNQGDFKFKNISKSAGIISDDGWSSSVVVADVNADGWDDIYVTRELYDRQPERRKNLLYINNKDLTFTESAEAYGIADPARTRHAVFFDYDNDGDLDLYCLNQPPNVGNYSDMKGVDIHDLKYSSHLYKNENGRFVKVTREAGLEAAGFPNSVVASDLDQDGWIDLYVASDYAAPDRHYRNNGDGTFTNIITSSTGHTSFYSMGVDAADINNDGLSDVMVLDMVAEDNFRLKSNMSGMNVEAFWKVVADSGHYQYMFNTLQLNRGNNQFSEIAQLAGVATTDWSWSNLIADLDNDGQKDIYITNGLHRDIRNTDAEKEFSIYVIKKINDYITKNPNDGDVTIWDVIDLKKALKIIPSQKLPNYVYQNTGNYTFDKKGKDWGLNKAAFSNGSAYVDLNNDGWLDLVTNNINEAAFIYKNNGAENTTNHYLRLVLNDNKNKTTLGTKIYCYTDAGMQYFETTGVHGMYSTSEHKVHFGLGKNQSVDSLIIRWPDGIKQKIAAIKADQELVVEKAAGQKTNPAKSTLLIKKKVMTGIDYKHKENIFDDYKYQVLLPHKLSQNGPAAAVGDVNGDGLDDLYLGGACGQAGSMYLQQDDGQFIKSNSEEVWGAHSICEDIDALFFDADSDSDIDLYVVSGGNEFPADSPFYGDRLYLNDGGGNFSLSKSSIPPMTFSGAVVRAADIDQDGDQDLFVGGRLIPHDYPAAASSRILLNDKGVFTDITTTYAPFLESIGLVTDAQFTDLNQDGFPDLMLAGEWMPLQAYLNDGKKMTTADEVFSKAATTGWWNSITVADLDQDGDDDFLFGNLGLNYKYKASDEEPFEVHYADFDANGTKDIVLSYYNFGSQYPLRGRSCSAQQVPMLKEKFPGYDAFAKSDLSAVYNPVILNAALHLRATTFASMIGINDGAGHIELKPLPVEAQFSSINAAVVDDLDKDGLVDILLGGNLFNAEIETARNDAGLGLLLKGCGQGAFTSVPAIESGMMMRKEVKKILSINIQNTRYYLFINNDDTPVFLTTSP